MSKQVEVKYLDGDFTVLEDHPASAQELISLIGEEAVVDNTNANLLYRNKYPRVYGKVSETIASENAFPRLKTGTKTKKDGSSSDVLESEMDHIRAFLYGRKNGEGVIESPAPEENKTILQALFELHGQAEPMFVQGERAGTGGKISQAAIDTANLRFAAGEEAVSKMVTGIETLMGSPFKVGRDADGEVTPETLARAIQALNIKAKRDAEATVKAQLAAVG